MDVGLIGCGFIGTLIAEKIREGELDLDLRVLLDRNPEKMEHIQGLLSPKPIAAGDIKALLELDLDMVIEAASIGAVHAFARDILSSGKDLLVMSVGAFAEEDFTKMVERTCNEKGSTVYLPSGAIGALDAVLAAREGGLESVEITTYKHPRSLEGAPYLDGREELLQCKGPMEIFSGNALQAIEGFPANVNVAVTLSLAGIGVERTRVRIIADPGLHRNVHEVRVEGAFGNLLFRTENNPFPENPKTSLLAGLSAISSLRKMRSHIRTV